VFLWFPHAVEAERSPVVVSAVLSALVSIVIYCSQRERLRASIPDFISVPNIRPHFVIVVSHLIFSERMAQCIAVGQG
jgi:ABC-type spermidine/putrescine transport system permease subunit II